jgi:hypothetical protein
MTAELIRLLKNKTAASYGVLQLLAPIALLTMWVAPAAAYVLADTDWYNGYRLWVPAETYFRLAAPGTVALLGGLRLAEWLSTRRPPPLPEAPRAAFWCLLAGGASAQALLPFMEGYLRYPTYLCSLLLWPALMLGLQIWPLRRRLIMLGGGSWALLWSVQSTFFGSGILWMLALWLHARARSGGSAWRDWTVLVGLPPLVLFLFSFKYDYREQKAAQPEARGLFFRLAADKLLHPTRVFHPAVFSRTLSRFNQGFHTAQAMAYVPSRAPFARGETIRSALWGALVPRWLDAQKPRAGGKENMRRFAGQNQYRISANIGIYGEAYVNFGAAGGWMILFAYGGLLGVLWKLGNRFLGAHWIPYIFLPAVIVESDFGIVINHICKSALIAATLTLFWHAVTHFRRRTRLQ